MSYDELAQEIWKREDPLDDHLSSVRQLALQMNSWDLFSRANICPAFDGQDFLPLSAILSELKLKTELTLNFCSLDDGYIWVTPGQDGVIFSASGEPVASSLRHRDQATPLPAAADLASAAVQLDFDIFVSVDAAWPNYYHWLCIALPKMMIARNFEGYLRSVIPGYRARVAYSEAVWRNSLEMCGLSESVQLPTGLYRAPKVATIIGFPSWFPAALDATYDRARTRLRNDPSSPKRILIQRADATRLTTGELQLVEDAAHRRGFTSVKLETLDFFTQADLFHNAEAVMGPHGSGFSNLLFGKSSLAVLEINRPLDLPAQYLRPWFYLLARARGQRYSFINAADLSAERINEAIDRLLSA